VFQRLLDGQQVVADLDDVLDGLLDSLPDAVGGGADLVGELRFEQVVIEPDDDRSPLGCLATVWPPVRATVLSFADDPPALYIAGAVAGGNGGAAMTVTNRCIGKRLRRAEDRSPVRAPAAPESRTGVRRLAPVATTEKDG